MFWVFWNLVYRRYTRSIREFATGQSVDLQTQVKEFSKICNEKQVLNFGSYNLCHPHENNVSINIGLFELGRAEITALWAIPALAHPWLRACSLMKSA